MKPFAHKRLKLTILTSMGILCAVAFPANALLTGSDLLGEMHGHYPVIDEVAAHGNYKTWRVGMKLTIPAQVTPKLNESGYDGADGIYAFLDRDLDDSKPDTKGIDLSHSTIEWYIVPKGTTRENYDSLRPISIGLNLTGQIPAGNKVLIGRTSQIILPSLALGNQIGFEITPKTSIGLPNESPKIVVVDIRYVSGQIDPMLPNIPPLPDPDEPKVINPAVPPNEIDADPTIGQPKIYIYQETDWAANGVKAVPIDTILEENEPYLVQTNTRYVARILRDENIPHTPTLEDDIDVTDRITKPINWYLYNDDILIEDGIAVDRLSVYEGTVNGAYKTQTVNNEATLAARNTPEKSEQKLRLRAGFMWDPDDLRTWPIFDEPPKNRASALTETVDLPNSIEQSDVSESSNN